MKTKDMVLVQVRLPPAEVAELRETGRQNKRSLPKEIRHRLRQYRPSDEWRETAKRLQSEAAELLEKAAKLDGKL